MALRYPNAANRERFLKAAVAELQEHGISDFSIRRVAKRCDVSCAAPYKHFESRNDLLLEVVKFINKKWITIFEQTVSSHSDKPLKVQIVAVCMAYLTFLCTYPEYQTILFMNDKGFPPDVLAEKGKLSKESERLIKEYCESVNMPDDVLFRKKLMIRSLLNGSAILINSGELPFDSNTIVTIRANIEREFEIE
jgi:AcrR family transcriptional regulator